MCFALALLRLETITFCGRKVIRVEDIDAAFQASRKFLAIPTQTLPWGTVCVRVKQRDPVVCCGSCDSVMQTHVESDNSRSWLIADSV
jgi:hypothetical protein